MTTNDCIILPPPIPPWLTDICTTQLPRCSRIGQDYSCHEAYSSCMMRKTGIHVPTRLTSLLKMTEIPKMTLLYCRKLSSDFCPTEKVLILFVPWTAEMVEWSGECNDPPWRHHFMTHRHQLSILDGFQHHTSW